VAEPRPFLFLACRLGALALSLFAMERGHCVVVATLGCFEFLPLARFVKFLLVGFDTISSVPGSSGPI
jgi:hypothetical protein